MKTPPAPPSRILLIDDNRDGLLVRRLVLEELGYTVEAAEDGACGLVVYERGHIDVVVTDYKMPGMNGGELIQRIRAVDPLARIILLSGFVDALGLTEENTGADAVILKSSHEAQHLARSIKRLANRQYRRKPPRAQKKAAIASRVSNLSH